MNKGLQLVIAGAFVFVTAMNSFSAEKVTLRLAWWGNPTRDERTLKVVELYKKLNPHVTIETETTGWGGYWDKLGSQAAAKNLPDIIQQDYGYLSQYAKRDLLLDLKPYVSKKTINLADVPDDFISGGNINNKLFGISLGTNAFALIIDTEMLKKAGIPLPNSATWTWDDFEKIATEMYKKSKKQVPVFCNTDPKVLFDNMLRQTKQSFFNTADGASLGFKDTKLLIEFYETQLRLLKSGVMTSADVSFPTVTPQESKLAKGDEWIGMGFWSNQVVMMQAAMNRPVTIVLLPKIKDSKRPGTFLKPSMFFSIPKASKNKEEAAKFIDFFINNIEANKILLGERGIPIVPKVRDALKAIVDPVNKQVFEFIELVGNKNSSPIDPPDPAGAGEVLKVFRTIDQEVLYKKTTPEKAAEKFMKEANKILAKNKR